MANQDTEEEKENHHTKPYKTSKADVQQKDKTYRNVLDGPSVKTAREFNITGVQTCCFFSGFKVYLEDSKRSNEKKKKARTKKQKKQNHIVGR